MLSALISLLLQFSLQLRHLLAHPVANQCDVLLCCLQLHVQVLDLLIPRDAIPAVALAAVVIPAVTAVILAPFFLLVTCALCLWLSVHCPQAPDRSLAHAAGVELALDGGELAVLPELLQLLLQLAALAVRLIELGFLPLHILAPLCQCPLGVVEGGAGGVELRLEEGEGLGEVRDGLLLQRELLHLRDHPLVHSGPVLVCVGAVHVMHPHQLV
mmetsp:Transcript_32843/g.77379  ORF Transcript_32843/g.77379 Transcript_32843/m.77379 type:complete len:214 (+) Transcript_32843:50-691(+)